MPSFTWPAIMLASVLLVDGCAASAPLMPPHAPPIVAAGPYYVTESDYRKDQALLAFAVDDMIFDGEPTGHHVLPVRYERGVEETVRWEGAGHGVATLMNHYGQTVYRIEEGTEAFRGMIPPGDYVLTLTNVTPQDGQVLTARVVNRGLALDRQLQWAALSDRAATRGGREARPERGKAQGGRAHAYGLPTW